MSTESYVYVNDYEFLLFFPTLFKQMPGVVKFLSAADIPGTNASLQPPLVPFEAEPVSD